jgi:hypothetical protein
MNAFYSGNAGDTTDEQVKEYLGANDVRTVVVPDGTPGDWSQMFGFLGQPRRIGGTSVWTVPRSILRQYADTPRPPG